MTAELRAAIVAIAAAGSPPPDVGTVHGRERYAASTKDLVSRYVRDGRLKGGYVALESRSERALDDGLWRVEWLWRLTLYRALDDGGESQTAFEQSLDALARAFRADDWRGRALTAPWAFRADIDNVSFGGVLAHRARCGLAAETLETAAGGRA